MEEYSLVEVDYEIGQALKRRCVFNQKFDMLRIESLLDIKLERKVILLKGFLQ